MYANKVVTVVYHSTDVCLSTCKSEHTLLNSTFFITITHNHYLFRVFLFPVVTAAL